MATITNRGNGSWRITISDGFDGNGKRKRITRTIHVNPKATTNSQRVQVEKEAARLQADIDRKLINDAKKFTFESVYQDYIEDISIRRTARTADDYRKLFKRELLPTFGKTAIREIDSLAVNRFLRGLAKRGLSGTYCLKYYQQLNQLFTFAKENGIIVVNPCDSVRPPRKDTPEASYYERAEALEILDKLSSYADIKWKAFFMLSFFTGCRPGEIIGLNWDDLDEDILFIQAGSYRAVGKQTVRTDKPKTKRSVRKIKLPAEALQALRAWKAEQSSYKLLCGGCWPEPDAMFTNELGNRIRQERPSKKWKEFTTQNGIRHLPYYDLRHTNCSLLISSKELSVEEVAARMGHEQTSTTLNIYSHAFADANERATSALMNVLKAASE